MLIESSLAPNVKEIAYDILHTIAVAESIVHDISVENAELHEVGAVDSVADTVASAFLIDAVDIRSWSCDPLPCGSGRVTTWHGELPIPVPTVAEMRHGYPHVSRWMHRRACRAD